MGLQRSASATREGKQINHQCTLQRNSAPCLTVCWAVSFGDEYELTATTSSFCHACNATSRCDVFDLQFVLNTFSYLGFAFRPGEVGEYSENTGGARCANVKQTLISGCHTTSITAAVLLTKINPSIQS